MRVSILRQKSAETEPYREIFKYDGSPDNTVAGLLDHINYNDDITDINGRRTERIGWECSCLQGICGACAMVINGVPALACETFVRDLKGEEIDIRPLSKFPVIHDLIVDRTSIHENLRQTNIYIGEYRPAEKTDHAQQYIVAKCLKCGLCLEVCPNYVNGKNFFGAVFANDCYLAASRNSSKSKDISGAYSKHFGADCSKSLSCMDVCPMKIPTITSIARLNRK
ncbi:MAG: succinate dehydrogenase/fumarate reductase iron-sulfur subunit [Clostridia bacterium]|nr:succinate dehydrogenase/fumarate reductase iron-sulfur subunit [Clostridia bacterium]